MARTNSTSPNPTGQRRPSSRNKYIYKSNPKHNLSRTPEYWAYKQMRRRCENPKAPHYEDYGGRGIRVCERWSTLEQFLADMGPRPSPKHSLDRIDNDKGYSPENCRWATDQEQCNNKRNQHFITYKKQTKTIAQWARELGIRPGTLMLRFLRGWSVERAFTQAIRKRSK